MMTFFKKTFYYTYSWVCVARVRRVWKSEDYFSGADSLLPCAPSISNSGHQAWWQVLSPILSVVMSNRSLTGISTLEMLFTYSTLTAVCSLRGFSFWVTARRPTKGR